MARKKIIRVAEIAPLWKTVPPQKYGGTELVVYNLTEGLAKIGAKVTLFACGGSKTSGRLVKVIEKPMYDLVGGFSWNSIQAYEFLLFDELFKRVREFDIIHNHLGFHPLVFSSLVKIPIVTTLHTSLPPDFPYLAERFKRNIFVSISYAQRKIMPYLHFVANIYHGIDTSIFSPNYKYDNGYFFFLGTLSKNKGVDLAVKACDELGEKLIIAGEIRDEDKSFLEKEVFPFVDGEKIKFIGEVNHAEKAKLFAHSRGLLFPIRWAEAFGLVVIESLACGAPVIGFNNGSLPEIIKNGEVGYLVNTFEEFKERIKEIDKIDRKKCRKYVEEKFSLEIMSKNYYDLFAKLIKI